MAREIMDFLKPTPSKKFIDFTFGFGGHAKLLLSFGAKVTGIDRDKESFLYGKKLEKQNSRFKIIRAKFSDIYEQHEKSRLKNQNNGKELDSEHFMTLNPEKNLCTYTNANEIRNTKWSNKNYEADANKDMDKKTYFKEDFSKIISEADGILLDFGVSSEQIDNQEKGFSFTNEGPLKMQMGLNNVSAYDVVNLYDQHVLADIIYHYGDEVKSRQIASKIMEKRKEKKIETTKELSDIVNSCFRGFSKKPHSAKTFQAIRMFVNDEVNEIVKILHVLKSKMKAGAKLATITFHSGEDKIIKKEFKGCFLTTKPKFLQPSLEETLFNSRSRSAKLRLGAKKII
ncbi:16S rRNA (cytosine(1402)-N(4))-methyltransferase RsmH [Candidatus Nesciobacter abundans]|uniref:Ribosomal RNA small subunit methyltransferase H n=2 Tax=Candidatus Nesciobacter abundans TaxID=2601668 RepID=A0A5C0UHW4_9PROT|nr:16S rRNA (cytosine(1402)-N(4))-methyltransferase RsmH [Candidatus Nesciobacter abundans]